ncbi:HupE/UreJ family protein [Pseudophaeobacter sp. 1A09344]|uniref:HupE/UreJ family protein n=1 Tax=Pseudophaeobacter sp. 1A09344 TaxID=3098144 RepID=UPI0034D629EA
MTNSLLLRGMKVACLCLLSSLGFWGAERALAHEVTPAIGDFTIEDNTLHLSLRLNAEAFVAGIDLDTHQDTEAADQAGDYDLLRAMPPEELAPMLRLFSEDWLKTLDVEAGRPVPLVVEDVRVAPVGDVELPRESVLSLSGELPPLASALTIRWPEGAGAVVLRQNGVEEPFTGYIQGGESTGPIAIGGGSALSPAKAFTSYIPVGFDHILPKGLDHILFVLGLFFLSTRLKPLLWQVSAFTVAHTITLACGALGLVTVNPAVVEPLIAASIVFVAVENIFARRLHSWRTVVIFGFGLLHGLGFASVLGEFGLPQAQFIPALIGFNVGVELGQLTVIALAYLLVGYWFGGHPKYRGRVAIPASVTIALIGSYWFVERVWL